MSRTVATIELAAARLRVLSVRDLLARSSDLRRLAAGGSGRHSAVWAVFDSAWTKLGEDVRLAFA